MKKDPRRQLLRPVLALLLGGCACGTGDEGDTSGAEEGPSEPSIVRLDLNAQMACATFSDGAASCWGRGGALGYGEAAGSNLGDDEPAYTWGLLSAGGNVLGVKPIGGAGCLAYTDGSVRCWGSGATGALGSGSAASVYDTPDQRPPVELMGEVLDLAGSHGRFCALLGNGLIQCWGFNELGALGYGSTENIGDDELPNSVGAVPVGAPVQALAMGGDHTCALLPSGAVKCWGRSSSGQLGRGSTDTIGDDETPEAISPIELGPVPVVQLSAGYQHTCARHEDGALTCWGNVEYGAIGYPGRGSNHVGDDEVPASVGQVQIGGRAIDVAAGQLHTCVLLEGGSVRCWGDTNRGQLGLGHTDTIGDDEHPASAGLVRVR